MALIPLLASAACGIFDFRVAEEPVRRIGMMNEAPGQGQGYGIKKYQVWVEDVDFEGRKLRCRPAVGSNGDERENEGEKGEKRGGDGTFEVRYDELVVAPGYVKFRPEMGIDLGGEDPSLCSLLSPPKKFMRSTY